MSDQKLRSQVIRLAASMPKGSDKRRKLIAVLHDTAPVRFAASPMPSDIDGIVKGLIKGIGKEMDRQYEARGKGSTGKGMYQYTVTVPFSHLYENGLYPTEEAKLEEKFVAAETALDEDDMDKVEVSFTVQVQFSPASRGTRSLNVRSWVEMKGKGIRNENLRGYQKPYDFGTDLDGSDQRKLEKAMKNMMMEAFYTIA